MYSLRTKETEEIYQRDKILFPFDYCPFCDENKRKNLKTEYKYWLILPNDYPYDLVFSVSDLLICKRHVQNEVDLTVEEMEELVSIKRQVKKGEYYSVIWENTHPRQTIPPHYHVHFLTF